MSDNSNANRPAPRSPFRRPNGAVGVSPSTSSLQAEVKELEAKLHAYDDKYASSGNSPFGGSSAPKQAAPAPVTRPTAPAPQPAHTPAIAASAMRPTEKVAPAFGSRPVSQQTSLVKEDYQADEKPAIMGGGIATGAGFKFTPMMTTAEKKQQEVNPFAPRVEKTEEQIREEEERARIARENSFIENQKKSKLDSLMDKLNQPLF